MTSVSATSMNEEEYISQDVTSGFWRESYEQTLGTVLDWYGLALVAELSGVFGLSSSTAMRDPWFEEEKADEAVVTVSTTTKPLLISDLGWTYEEALETRLRLSTFEEDWDAPGMEDYDDL